jgi:hypothetical protein
MLKDWISPAGWLGFIKQEHVTLTRVSVRRHVVYGIVVDGMKEKSVAIIEKTSVICCHAVGDAASGPYERLLTHSEPKIFPIEIRGPKEYPFDLLSCQRRTII